MRISGNLKGTSHIADLALVAAAPPANTAVREERTIARPVAFSVEQNYPNPFNSSTVIRFELDAAAEVELVVYNLAGQKIATLVRGMRQTGSYAITWDGRDARGLHLASGMYLYRLSANRRVKTRKLLLLR